MAAAGLNLNLNLNLNLWELSLLAMAVYQINQYRLIHRYREQARSHKDFHRI